MLMALNSIIMPYLQNFSSIIKAYKISRKISFCNTSKINTFLSKISIKG